MASCAVVVMVLVLLWKNVAGADVVLMGGALVLVSLGLMSPAFPGPRALAANFGNEGVLTVAVLFIVAAGLSETGGLGRIAGRLLGRPRTTIEAQARLMVSVAPASAFVNNTPLVAMMIPVVNDWCRRTGLSPSKLLMPLSYAAILGGVTTLIGTSTNLVVLAQMVDAHAVDPSSPTFGMFTLTPIGVPVALVGLAYILAASRWLLSDRTAFRADVSDPRQYTVEMMVQPGSGLDGLTIETAGLRRLPGAYLSALERDGELLAAVGPEQVLRPGDRLVFVGVVESVAELQRIRGLVPATDEVVQLTASLMSRLLVEAVISDSSPLVGRTIRDGQFRARYDAAVIAVYRNGARISGKIGNIALRAGDAVLLQAHRGFAERHRDNRDFLLVSSIEGTHPVRHHRATAALLILVGMVALVAFEPFTHVTVFHAALLAAAAMGLSGSVSVEQARRSFDPSILVAIIGALTIGEAMNTTGLAASVAAAILQVCAPFGPWAALAGVYLVTLLFTELVTNNAAAALVFPIAKATAVGLGAHLMPFAIVVAIAASCGFATPIGYQTHLMVYGPGGYRFADFLRMGLPLDLLCMVVTVAITPLVYPF